MNDYLKQIKKENLEKISTEKEKAVEKLAKERELATEQKLAWEKEHPMKAEAFICPVISLVIGLYLLSKKEVFSIPLVVLSIIFLFLRMFFIGLFDSINAVATLFASFLK